MRSFPKWMLSVAPALWTRSQQAHRCDTNNGEALGHLAPPKFTKLTKKVKEEIRQALSKEIDESIKNLKSPQELAEKLNALHVTAQHNVFNLAKRPFYRKFRSDNQKAVDRYTTKLRAKLLDAKSSAASEEFHRSIND